MTRRRARAIAQSQIASGQNYVYDDASREVPVSAADPAGTHPPTTARLDIIENTLEGITDVLSRLIGNPPGPDVAQAPGPVPSALGLAPPAPTVASLEPASARPSSDVSRDSNGLPDPACTDAGGEFEDISRCISGLGADGALSGGLKAGDSVPMKYKEDIWSNKYVDMYDILYPNKEHAMALTIQGDGDNPTLGVVSKRKYELEELEWATAFDDFMAVYLLKYPNDRSDILTYAKHIKIMMRDQLNWRAYDQKFRQGREMTGCKWSSIRVDLQIECSRLYASSHSPNPIPASPRFHMRSQSVPVGYCYSFHSRNQNCVAGAVCTYKHSCPNCDKFHPRYRPCPGTQGHSITPYSG